jgi:hypothetical protein
MSKLTQKEMLIEGFLDTIRKAAGTLAGGAIGAAGSIAKDIIKGDTGANPFASAKRGALKGGKLGLKLLTPFEEKLKKLLEDNTYYLLDWKGNSTQGSASVAELKYDDKGKIIPGRKYTDPLVYNTKNGNLAIVKAPKRTSGNVSTPTTPQQPTVGDKPKFNDALRKWKIQNIGPDAGNVGITYQQAKKFLQSLKVQDPDRVLNKAEIKDRGAAIIPNSKLNTVKFTLQSRNIVSEETQINLLKQLNLLNDSYNKKYELSKYKNY